MESESRRRILDMLAEGKITVEEAERLLAAIDQPSRAGAAGQGPGQAGNGKVKYLRVIVEPNTDSGQAADPERVNIRVPLALIEAGVKLSALVPHAAAEGLNEAMKGKGLDFDVRNIKAEAVDSLIEALRGLEVDVQEPGQKVRIFTE